MIEVQHLTKRYGRVTAVDDVSFKVEPGEILGFLGPNGAGKTTTMRILTGYMYARTPDKARVFLVSSYLEATFNKSAFDLRDKDRKSVV